MSGTERDDAAFTPSMERLRDEYVKMRAQHYGFTDLYAAEFDRALAQHDAAVAAWARAEALWEAASDIAADCTNQPGPCICVARDWLRDRAERIESEGRR